MTPASPLSDDTLDDRLLGVIDKLEAEEISPATGNAIANVAGKYIDRQRLKLKYAGMARSGRVTATAVPDPRAERIRSLEAELAALKAAG